MRPVKEIWRDALRQENLYKNSVLFSLLFHVGLFLAFQLRHLFPATNNNLMEIDLTKPFRIGGNPLLKPGGGTTPNEVKNPGPPAPMEEVKPEKKEPPKDWIIPGPNTQTVEKPVPESSPSETQHPQGIEGGWGDGYKGTGGPYGGGDGEGGGLKLDRFPKLLNKREVIKLLKKNYPPEEREAGIMGKVIVDLHLDSQGNVLGVDVVGTGGKNFDAAAKVVAPRMRFEPALVNAAPVAVKIRQPIYFKLDEEEE